MRLLLASIQKMPLGPAVLLKNGVSLPLPVALGAFPTLAPNNHVIARVNNSLDLTAPDPGFHQHPGDFFLCPRVWKRKGYTLCPLSQGGTGSQLHDAEWVATAGNVSSRLAPSSWAVGLVSNVAFPLCHGNLRSFKVLL